MKKRKLRSPTKKPVNSGVYVLRCTANSREYVGSAQNLHVRKLAHMSELRAGTHVNPKLQAAFNKYGAESFVFNVLMECPIDSLLDCEQAAMYDRSPWFNIAKIAGAPMRGRKASPATLEKLRVRMLGNTYTKGRPLSEKHRAALRASHTNGWPYPKRGPYPTEARAKLSAALKGRIFTDAEKSKISEGQRRRWEQRRCANAA